MNKRLLLILSLLHGLLYPALPAGAQLLTAGIEGAASVAYQVMPIRTFGGLNTDDPELALAGAAEGGRDLSPDSENVVTDEGVGVGGRLGYTSYSTNTATDIWELPHSNGTRYSIIVSSNNIKADIGGKSYNIQVSTVAVGLRTAGAVLGDAFYFMNKTDGLKKVTFSGVTPTVTVASATLKGDIMAAHRGRIWLGNVTSSERILYGSKYLDGTTWALPTTDNPPDTDPVQLTISGALDEILTALKPFQDKLVWMKAHSFGAIYGSRRSNFQQKVFSEKVGTNYPDSIQDCDGTIRWLGPARTAWEWSGGVFTDDNRISVGADELFGELVQGDANTRSWTQTTQVDWQAGTIGDGLTATESPGDVQFSSSHVTHDNFTDGDFTGSPAWTLSYSSIPMTASISGGQFYMTSTSSNSGSGLATFYSSTYASSAEGLVIYKYTYNDGAGYDIPSRVVFSTNATGVAPSGLGISLNGLSGNAFIIRYQNGFRLGNLNGVPPAHGMSEDTQYELKITISPDGTISLYKDGSLLTSASTTTFVGQTFKSIHFGMGDEIGTSLTTGQVYYDDIRVATGAATFQSQSFNIGTAITSWSTFEAGSSNGGGSHSFAIYTDTNSSFSPSNAATFTSSQTITSGSLITLATAAYVAVVDSFARTASTHTPVLSDFTIGWNEGSTLRVASGYTSQRYWLGVAISSTGNNKTLVYDTNREWQRWTIPATAMGTLGSTLLFSNASGMFQAESGYTDNGAAIAAYYTTPVYFPSESLDLVSYFHDLIVTTEQSDASLVTTYQVDGANTDYALGTVAMNGTTGFQNFKLPFSFDRIQQGKYVRFKFAVTGSSEWRLLGANLYHRRDLFPK